MSIEKFEGVYEARTPISHGSDEDFGMEQRLRTIEMVIEDDKGETRNEDIPVISGNGLRGYIRDLLAEHFLNTIDISTGDRLSYSLYSGGNLEKGTGKRRINRKMIKSIRENIPMLSLLGTAIGSEIISGKLKMGMLVPISKETVNYTNLESDKSVFEMIDETFYTRKDDLEGKKAKGKKQAQQMKFDVQILVPGTKLYHWMIVEHPTEIELSCLGKAFELFDQRPFVGGMSSRGHGKVDYEYNRELPKGDKYVEHLNDNKESIKEYVDGLDEKLEG